MDTRKILVNSVTVLSIIGLVLAAIPFISSLNPTQSVKENAKLKIKISSLPDNGALEVDWRHYKVFLVKKPKPMAFIMPFINGAYLLPDPTWERAIVPCEKFHIGNEGFSCVDPKLSKGWRENAKWELNGYSKSNWMPSLKRAPYIVEDKYIVLSPEYN